MTVSPLSDVRFDDPAAGVVWAAIAALDPASQYDVLELLRMRLALQDTGSDAPHMRRVGGCIGALRAVADRLGHAPSIADYRRARAQTPELPADATTRRVLGGNWNTALRRAHLDARPEDELVIAPVGVVYTEAECIAAISACATDLGRIPSLVDYRGWVVRPDVLARPGRRPRGLVAFIRLFGSWSAACQAAGCVRTCRGPDADGTVSPTLRAKYRYARDDLREGLRAMAAFAGRTPRISEISGSSDPSGDRL